MEENKKFIITIVILVFIILGLGSFIYYDKFYKTEKEEKTITTIDNVDIDLNSFYLVGDTLEKFDKAFNDKNSTYFGYIYKDRLLASKFDQGAALFAALYDNLVGTNTPQLLVGGDVKNNFETIFGKNLTYKADNLNAGQYYNILYDAVTDKYTYIAPTVREVYSPTFMEINQSTSLTEDSIIVKRKVFYVEYLNNASGTDITEAAIFTSSDKKTQVATIPLRNGILNKKEVISKYSSKLNTYKYTFKQASDGNYTFYSIEKEK